MFDFGSMNAASGVGGGSFSAQAGELEALRKSLDAGTATDVATLTGGQALSIQSLDHTLQATLADNKEFKLFNALSKMPAGNTVDEWTEATSQGGFPGSTANSQTGAIAAAQGSYARRTALVKYLMTMCQVSFAQSLVNTIVQSEATENMMGTLRLLRDVEHLSFYGDSDVVPTEFDGIAKQLISLGSSDHIVSAGAAPLSGLGATGLQTIASAAATIGGLGNFGTPTHLFTSPLAASDLDVNLDPAYRVPLSNGAAANIGTPVRGIVTAQGDIAIERDVFLLDQNSLKPFEVDYSAIAATNATNPVSVTAVAGADSASKFTTGWDGNYYYAVAGITNLGQSVVTKSIQYAVAVGDKVTLTITASAGGTETGYAIYRSRRNGTNTTSDFRLVARVAKGGATTTFVDYNEDIPGTSKAFLLNLNPGHTALTWRQLLPLTRFNLYPTNAAIIPWALLMFGYLRMTKRRHHVMIKNILPTTATWLPKG